MDLYKIFIFSNVDISKFDLLNKLAGHENYNSSMEDPLFFRRIAKFSLRSNSDKIDFIGFDWIFHSPYRTLKKTKLQYHLIKPHVIAGSRILIYVCEINDLILLDNFISLHYQITFPATNKLDVIIIGNENAKEFANNVQCSFLDLNKVNINEITDKLIEIVKEK